MTPSITARLGIALALALGLLWASHASAEPTYAIRSLNAPLPDCVTTGDAVAINVTGPSTAALLKAGLRLNGQDVTASLQPDGTAGSLTGTVPGLQAGVNTLRLFKSKTSQAEIAELRDMAAYAPDAAQEVADLSVLADRVAADMDPMTRKMEHYASYAKRNSRPDSKGRP